MPYTDPEQRRAYQREWRARRRAEWFEGRSCTICGSVENLQLDHVDPRQKVDHKVWSWNATRRDHELAKCQALCERCHKAKSKRELHVTHGFTPRPHGERRTYNAGCRCEDCTAAHRDYRRAMRARRKPHHDREATP